METMLYSHSDNSTELEWLSYFSVQTHVNGAAQQSSGLQGLFDDLEQVGWRPLEVVVLSDASSEILEALSG